MRFYINDHELNNHKILRKKKILHYFVFYLLQLMLVIIRLLNYF
jgi:hypothetical protein